MPIEHRHSRGARRRGATHRLSIDHDVRDRTGPCGSPSGTPGMKCHSDWRADVWIRPSEASRSVPLGSAERAFVAALARWKAATDTEAAQLPSTGSDRGSLKTDGNHDGVPVGAWGFGMTIDLEPLVGSSPNRDRA